MRDNRLIDGLYVIIVHEIVKSRRKIFGLAAAFVTCGLSMVLSKSWRIGRLFNFL